MKVTINDIEYTCLEIDGQKILKRFWDDYIGCGYEYHTLNKNMEVNHIGTTSTSYFGALDANKTEIEIIRKMILGTYVYKRVYDIG